MILGVVGASGSLGRLICQVSAEEKIDVRVLTRQALNDLAIWREVSSGCNVILDVSLPEGTESLVKNLRAALPHGLRGLIVGTTGHQPHQLLELEALSTEIPVVLAANFSRGVYLVQELLTARTQSGLQVAELLRELGFDLGIVETHHTRKKDAPSGTALAIARSAGIGTRQIAALRVGQTIGEHSIYASAADEEIRITHTAHSRRLFATGAVHIAKKMSSGTRAPGIYNVNDIYGESRLSGPHP
jgi:4-hydroxy-tetrahydrodipicolinate reductase